jgi:hypothetical protein
MKYIILSPFIPGFFQLNTFEQVEEACAEFGVKLTYSVDLQGNRIGFPTADTIEALNQMASTVDIPGTALEVTGIYDQLISTESKVQL